MAYFTCRKRACGIETPPPIPVDPSSSRFSISFATASTGKSRGRCGASCHLLQKADLVGRSHIDHYIGRREKVLDLDSHSWPQQAALNRSQMRNCC